jgi:predicted nucleic acid-binding protein
MNIVVDSNIFFSMLIKSDGKTVILFDGLRQNFDLYLSDVSFAELNKHQEKLLRASKLDLFEFEKIKINLLSHFTIVPSSFLSQGAIKSAYNFVKGVDINDLPFVASAIFLNGYLWTGDKVLYNGLKKAGYTAIYNSSDISNLISNE